MNLTKDQVHIWITCPDDIQDARLLTKYSELMSADEKKRQARFHFEKHRKAYLCTRALVRTILSTYASVEPEKWKFELNEFEKPEILRPNKTIPPLRFNLSHTDGMIVCAVMLDHDIGIDIESRNRSTDLLEIANRYFSPQEVIDLNRIPHAEQPWKFFEYWTLKESYIKACGMGLHIPLDHFSFGLKQDGKINITFNQQRSDDPLNWQFHLYHVEPNYYISLAVKTKNKLHPNNIIIQSGIPLKGFSPVHYNLKRHS